MINELTLAVVKDIIYFLSREPSFLSLSSKERKKKAPAIASLLGNMSEDDFLDDLRTTVNVMKNSEPSSQSKIIHGIARYFIQDFPEFFDQLDDSFYTSSVSEQKNRLLRLFPEKSTFFESLRGSLVMSSPQEITESLVKFLMSMYESPRLVVQSPVDCSIETKKEIRTYFFEKHNKSFVDFSVNPQLIGGIRFFVNGNVQDHSWFARITDIRRLRYLVG